MASQQIWVYKQCEIRKVELQLALNARSNSSLSTFQKRLMHYNTILINLWQRLVENLCEQREKLYSGLCTKILQIKIDIK